MSEDPVNRHDDGTWWFWDETWGDDYVPYHSEAEARQACRQYGDWLEGKGKFMPPDEWVDKRMKKMGIEE
jgi:hypothetical protein